MPALPCFFVLRTSYRLLALLALVAGAHAATPSPAFHAWATRPPMGWNSWDCFATTVTEAQTKAHADITAAKLLAHGWNTIVVDIQWYEPNATGYDYRKGAPVILDAYGRLLPATNKFPSAAEGIGFKALADYVHAKGLTFGIHLMRGIPRQAVEQNLPILGTPYHAADIADKVNVCPWNTDMYGVDMSKPGAQAYYDSVFALIASWGVDYVKVDDLSRPYLRNQPEVEAVRTAIDRTGRPMVLSLSPGETDLAGGAHVQQHANLWRISDDFWDHWPELLAQFKRLHDWTPHRTAGAWPDADMIPFGIIAQGRPTRFTPAEHYTLMTLWSIARSPLMMGGDLTKLDDFTLSLLTNDEVLAVNQHSDHNRQLRRDDAEGIIVWTADVPASRDRYLAVFNTRDPWVLHEGNRIAAPVSVNTPQPQTVINVPVVGLHTLVLSTTPNAPRHWRRGVWTDATFLDAQGRSITKPTDYGRDTERTTAVTVPAGAARFRATLQLDEGGRKQAAASLSGAVHGIDAASMATPDRELRVALDDVGYPGGARVRDLWIHRDLATATQALTVRIPWHGAGLYRLSPVR